MKKEIFLKRYWKILTTYDVKISAGLIFIFGYAGTLQFYWVALL